MNTLPTEKARIRRRRRPVHTVAAASLLPSFAEVDPLFVEIGNRSHEESGHWAAVVIERSAGFGDKVESFERKQDRPDW
ncbi:MAG TPA: hypothetical protein VF992_06115 [Thermoplasmata archaeon]